MMPETRYPKPDTRALGLAVLALILFAPPAHAVVPSALGPLQALIAILPHLLVLLGAAAVAVLKPSTYRALGRYAWAHKLLTLVLLGIAGSGIWGGSLLFGAAPVKEQVGAPWLAFRGGPERHGVVPGAKGPLDNPCVLRPYVPSAMGRLAAVDSSPAIVGNRVYFGVSAQSPFGKSGAIVCLDADTRAEVWKFPQPGDLDPRLQPVFSSPAIGGEFTLAGEKRSDKYLVVGEGYHDERNCRLICLDLEPVAAGMWQSPKVHWTRSTTSHIESSPCILEGKAYVGAGDDGVWCVELDTGELKWHLEGVPFYRARAGAQADALARLAGKTIVARGPVERIWPDPSVDISVLLMDVKDFVEGDDVSRLPSSEKGSETRTITGKLAVDEARKPTVEGASRVTIEIAEFCADAEASPLAVRLSPTDARLFFGGGFGSPSVVCVNAETGKLIWRHPTALPVFSDPTVVDGKVLVGLSNGTFVKSDPKPAGAVLCLSAGDGTELWQVKTGDGVLGAVPVRNGFAYACARDGNLYVIDLAAPGKAPKTFPAGGVMVCSPAVTDDAVYMATDQGKAFCFRRQGREHSFAWSLSLAPGQAILSSPAIAAGKLFVGSFSRGVFCVVETPGGQSARKAKPWTGPGGNAARSGCADDRGPPVIADNKARRLFDVSSVAGVVQGPLAASGDSVYVPLADSVARVSARSNLQVWNTKLNGPSPGFVADGIRLYAAAGGKLTCRSCDKTLSPGRELLWEQDAQVLPGSLALSPAGLLAMLSPGILHCLDSADGATLWKKNVSELSGAPCVAHNLIVLAVKSPQPRLLCLDDATGTTLWETPLPAEPITPPTVWGDKVFVGAKAKDAGQVFCHKLTDGSKLWDVETSEVPFRYMAASDDYLAFVSASGKVLVLKQENGDETQTLLVEQGLQPPAFVQNVLIIAGDNRVGALDAATGSWLWNFDEQEKIGRVLAPPVILHETVWLSTEKLGLIAIGGRPQQEGGK